MPQAPRDPSGALASYDESLSRLERTIRDFEEVDPKPGGSPDLADRAQEMLWAFLSPGELHRRADGASDMLDSSRIGAAIITASGLICEANAAAETHDGLTVGRTLADCGIEPVGTRVFKALSQSPEADAPRRHQIAQIHTGSDGGVRTVFLSPQPVAPGTDPRWLMILSPPPVPIEAFALITDAFGLSETETAIAGAFVRGQSLRQIADQRGRSYATIRNQFQAVLEKTDCATQVDLVQLATSLSLMQGAVRSFEGRAAAPARIDAADTPLCLPRPGGRRLEVRIDGDPGGRPVLNLFSLFGPGVTPAIAGKLRARNICLVSPWRPGFGGTDRPRASEDWNACFASDVRTLLDSLEIKRCAVLARASASQSFYELALRLPDRIASGTVVNGLVPRRYIAGKRAASRWTTTLMSASFVSYPVARMILAAGEKLLRRSDTVSFLQKMYDHSDSDRAALGDPDVAASILNGVSDVVRQGLDAGVNDIVSGFAAWMTDLGALDVPITLYHGRDDPNVPFASVAEFARDNGHCMALVPEDGGGQLCFSHIDKVLDIVLAEGPRA
ncbi:hypothetical protein [uncultured Jannaschia sp.]|uniref:hypothetical protein n=1 Tax=uncultured Jannaschia sp. TaxID=293347 RepID=UPI00262FFE4A|nr:hypothetical protein [uncultured Jannaschia sp.]